MLIVFAFRLLKYCIPQQNCFSEISHATESGLLFDHPNPSAWAYNQTKTSRLSGSENEYNFQQKMKKPCAHDRMSECTDGPCPAPFLRQAEESRQIGAVGENKTSAPAKIQSWIYPLKDGFPSVDAFLSRGEASADDDTEELCNGERRVEHWYERSGSSAEEWFTRIDLVVKLFLFFLSYAASCYQAKILRGKEKVWANKGKVKSCSTHPANEKSFLTWNAGECPDSRQKVSKEPLIVASFFWNWAISG